MSDISYDDDLEEDIDYSPVRETPTSTGYAQAPLAKKDLPLSPFEQARQQRMQAPNQGILQSTTPNQGMLQGPNQGVLQALARNSSKDTTSRYVHPTPTNLRGVRKHDIESNEEERIRKCITINSPKPTHIFLNGNKERFSVANEKTTQYWEAYCDAIAKDEKQCIAELNNGNGPIVLHFTFTFPNVDTQFQSGNQHREGAKDPINEDFITSIVSIVQASMLALMLVKESYYFLCCVCKSEPSLDTEGNLSIHVNLSFPFCVCDNTWQVKELRPHIIKNFRMTNPYSKIESLPLGDIENFIDPEIPVVYTPLYGSVKNFGDSTATLYNIYQYISPDNNHVIKQELSQDIFVASNHSDYAKGALSTDFVNSNKPISYFLPLFLSSAYWRLVSEVKTDIKSPKSPSYSPQEEEDTEMTAMCEDAVQLIRMINISRLKIEMIWMEVGRSLFNITRGSKMGFEIWKMFAEKTGLSGSVCNEMPSSGPGRSRTLTCDAEAYYSFTGSKNTMRTLAYYAKLDNPEQFNKWQKAGTVALINKAVSDVTDNAMAKAIHRHLWMNYAYDGDKWYQFENHKWHVNRQLNLQKNISGSFVNIITNIRDTLSGEIVKSKDPNFKKMSEIQMKAYTDAIKRVSGTTFKEKIIRECRELFHDYNGVNFNQHQNADINITGCEDCIIETYEDKVVVRAGRPDDFLTISTGCVLAGMDMHDKHPLVLKLMDWLTKVYPDPDLLKHFLKFSASCLRSGNADKLFAIFSGGGDNSKSMIVKLFEAAFGPYCIKFAEEMVTQAARSSSGPTPELAQAKWAKIAFIDEPEENRPLLAGRIKRMTGGDSYFARNCNEDGGKITSTFKLVLTCNDVPSFPKKEKALTSRVGIFPHISTWIHNPPEDPEEQMKQRLFKMDTRFEATIKPMAPAFLWLCTKYYGAYIREGLKAPEIVRTRTMEYWASSDVFGKFVSSCMVALEDKNLFVTTNQVGAVFKDWLMFAFPSMKPHNFDTIVKEMSVRLGPPKDNIWAGYRLNFVKTEKSVPQLLPRSS